MTERKAREFEEAFGPEGIWVVLLSRSTGYRKTEVRCEEGSRYRVTDYWNSHLEFEAFRQRFATELERFSRLVLAEGLVESETLLGAFYEDWPGADNGDDLVPA